MLRALTSSALALGLLAALPAGAAPPNTGRPFVVEDRPGTYAVSATTKQLTVRGADGAKLFVEAWLPARRGRAVPPKRVPVVVVATPYAMKGRPRPDRLAAPRWTEFFVSHGYALANVHLRGTGESGGCWGLHDRVDADDIGRALRAISTQPWSNGRTALFGKSHDGGAAVNAAARARRSDLRSLKAVIAVSPVLSAHDMTAYDGVGTAYENALDVDLDVTSSYNGRSFGDPTEPQAPDEYAQHGNKDPQHVVERAPCRAEHATAITTADGRMSPWVAEREVAAVTDRITAPTLFTYGLREYQTRQLVGAFDRILAPKAGIFSSSDHDYPDLNSIDSSLSRKDWLAMVLAWLDHWVGGVDNDVPTWPVAQVQANTGQWRAEPGFPRTGGPRAQLALGADGVLGATRPTGSTTYDELTTTPSTDPAQDGLVFRTPKLTAPLHLSGQPIGDLWLAVTRPDTKVMADLVVLDAQGNTLAVRKAARSTEFLQPLRGDRFVQATPVPPATGVPLHVQLRFEPTDTVVPKGGTVQISFYGLWPDEAVAPSASTVTLLHDCRHLSALRFVLPSAHPDLLDVLDGGQKQSDLGRTPRAAVGHLEDGAGIATRRPC